MAIQLSDHFTYRRLLRFVWPPITMMIFTSIYGVVDGFFISNYVGKIPFAAVNLIMPFLMILGALGFMLGAGGSALVSKTLGEGNKEKANQIFSMLVIVGIVTGCILAAAGILFLRPIAIFLGAEGEIINYCVIYGRIILIALPAFMLQNMFQSFLVTAERPELGLVMTVLAGVTNIVLDALFMGVLAWGTIGAAAATAISQAVGGIAPFFFFLKPKRSLLRLTKPVLDGQALLKTCTNGSSELVTNISMSVVSMLYNFQLLKYAGENGVAAYGVIMYVNFIFVAIFIGYAIGTAPIIGFHYGAGNESELKSIFKKSMNLNLVAGVLLLFVGLFFSRMLAELFVGYDQELCEMTVKGFRVYALSFLFCGFNIFGSSLFTALSNGLVSAIISFLRTLLFQVAAILVMPLIWGLDGIWYSVAVAEVVALILTMAFIIKLKDKYRYM
ncbi:MAG: MATE family efflux transporter [Lachnospiraceae bacterium]|nr:MATE family efflux transporter [Lachnospiraceae bacterium]